MKTNDLQVRCIRCSRTAFCVVMDDGTIYRPFAWEFSDKDAPLRGVCGICQTMRDMQITIVMDTGPGKCRHCGVENEYQKGLYVCGTCRVWGRAP